MLSRTRRRCCSRSSSAACIWPLLGYFFDSSHEAARLAGTVADEREIHARPDGCAIGAQVSPLISRARHQAVAHLLDGFGVVLPIIGVRDVHGGLADDGLGRATNDAAKRRVYALDHAVQVGSGEAHDRLVEGRVEPFFAGFQILLERSRG
jgi:hypothetical protein